MSTTSETPASTLIDANPHHTLVNFLIRESPRYIPLPGIFPLDAIFVNFWFQKNVFELATISSDRNIERIFEMMTLEFERATVLGIRHFELNRHTERNDSFRFRWTLADEISAEVFLISCCQSSDHVAVIPTAYMRRRYGSNRVMEGPFHNDEPCPKLLAPFMVHRRDLVSFLEEIYTHANTSSTVELSNPTYSAKYHNWRPELHYLKDILPNSAFNHKLLSMRDFYFASKVSNLTMRLSYRKDSGHFSLEGNAIEYYRRSWYQHQDIIRIRLKRKLSGRADWKFVLLEDFNQEYALCLPRDKFPCGLIGSNARHGDGRNVEPYQEAEVLARSLHSFSFRMISPLHTVAAVASIIEIYAGDQKLKALPGLAENGQPT